VPCRGADGGVTLLRGLTFDLWQTLIYDTRDSGRNLLRAEGVAGALADLGLSFAPAEILAAIEAVGNHHDRLDSETELGPWEQVGMLLGRLGVSPQVLPRAQATAFPPYAEAALALPPEVFPQAAPVAGHLAQEYPLALICNTGMTPGPVLRVLLERFDLKDHFRVLVFSDELGYRKPSPRAFEAAVRGLGLQPREAVHVGDNPYSDVHGARQFGMRAILLSGGRHGSRPYRHPREEGALAPDAVVEGLSELPAAVRELAQAMEGNQAG